MKRRLSHSTSSASVYSAMILKRTPNITDSFNAKDADNVLPQALPKSRWSTLKTRSLYGMIMLVGLYFVLVSGPLAIIGLIAIVQTLVFKEVISIAHFRSQEKKLPWFRTITWYTSVLIISFVSQS
jgi:phosphatidate cytidylyltransferase